MKIREGIVKIYEEYFELPEEGKIREKVFIARIAMSVVVMGIWMAMMGFSAYAYFSSSVTSGVNVIKSATYSLDITDVTESDGVTKVTGEYVLENQSKTDNKTYKFMLTKAGDASVGYCKIITKIGTVQNEIYTTPIGIYMEANKEVKVDSMEVQIVLAPEATMTVEFVANWGSYSGNNEVANAVLDYGLSEAALKALREVGDNATATIPTENPVNAETDTSADEGTEAPVGGTPDATSTTDTTADGTTNTTSDTVTDTTSDESDDGAGDTPKEGSDTSSIDVEETTEVNGELMN
ncbi:MAG: hypothetical protein IJZ53_03360 [Tyzzerella sp.]|nr:hypothetical protein [Tyzzerella sp.]